MDMTVILGATAVVASVGAVWWALAPRPSRASANLFAGLEVAGEQRQDRTSQFGTAVRRFVPKPLLSGLEAKLVQAGHPRGLDLPRLLAVKTFVGLILGVLSLLLGQPLLALALGLFGFFIPDVWVGTQRDKRRASMRDDAPDMIDQLTICVEAGLGLDAALTRVASSTDGPLSEELSRVLQDMRAGMAREQALRAMVDRTDLPDLRQVILALIQAQKHGVPIADTLRVQSAEIRVKRKQRTEEKAAKLPVKILFPTMLFIMPALFIVLLGPAFLQITHGFGGQ